MIVVSESPQPLPWPSQSPPPYDHLHYHHHRVCLISWCHSMLTRGDEIREARISDLTLHTVEHFNAPTEMKVLQLATFQGKMNQHGRVEFHVSPRHKHVLLCPVGTMAAYLYHRFMLSNEKFPVLETKDWYNIVCLVSPTTATISNTIPYHESEYHISHHCSNNPKHRIITTEGPKQHSANGLADSLHHSERCPSSSGYPNPT